MCLIKDDNSHKSEPFLIRYFEETSINNNWRHGILFKSEENFNKICYKVAL